MWAYRSTSGAGVGARTRGPCCSALPPHGVWGRGRPVTPARRAWPLTSRARQRCAGALAACGGREGATDAAFAAARVDWGRGVGGIETGGDCQSAAGLQLSGNQRAASGSAGCCTGLSFPAAVGGSPAPPLLRVPTVGGCRPLSGPPPRKEEGGWRVPGAAPPPRLTVGGGPVPSSNRPGTCGGRLGGRGAGGGCPQQKGSPRWIAPRPSSRVADGGAPPGRGSSDPRGG